VTVPLLGLLDHLVLRAADVDALVEAYRDALDAVVFEREASGAAEGVRMHLANIDVLVTGGEPSSDVVAAFRIQDADAFRDHLDATAFEVERVEDIPGGVVLTFRDPAGNRLQAVRWGGRVEDLEPDVPTSSP
jgi:catechol 2,3-dioxygenase-like lactoylglutathione lyase family enzyme